MKKTIIIASHSFILFLFAFALFGGTVTFSEYFKESIIKSFADNILYLGWTFALVYTSYFLYIPQYLIKKEYLKFFLLGFSIMVGFTLMFNGGAIMVREITGIIFHKFVKVDWLGLAFWTFPPFLLGTGVRMFIKTFEDAQEKLELEKQNFKSEVSLLKNQLNPHFLFNTLNNIDSLITENQANASLALNKLSEIMRYMVYDSEKELVPLEDEINYIKNYISLQKLRIKNEDIIKLDIIGETDRKLIAPMIFISFVENAFKHSSLKDREENKIEIKFVVKEDSISFHSSNKIADIEKDKSSGVGLEIVKKRLNLIYQNNRNLNLERSNGSFNVDLDIKLL